MSVIKLHPSVTHRCCPKCGYLISQREIDLAVINFECVRGCGKSLSDFQPMWIKPNP